MYIPPLLLLAPPPHSTELFKLWIVCWPDCALPRASSGIPLGRFPAKVLFGYDSTTPTVKFDYDSTAPTVERAEQIGAPSLPS